MGYKLINYCEIEPNASRSYSRIHNVSEDLNLGDITKVNAKNIPDFDMLVGGSPCFVAGTKVYTSEGYKNIEDLKVGDLVLTHKNRYCKVTKVGNTPNQQIWEVKTLFEKSFHTTGNHPFMVAQMEEAHYTDNEFKSVDTLNYNDYLVGFVHIAKYGELGCSHYIYDKVTSIVKTNAFKTVYNIEVEEDHTYVVNDRIVHNCTDFSSAGQQKGSVWTCLDCGYKYNPIEQHYSKRDECPHCHSKNLERTASSLIVEYLRVLREKKPKFCVYENVKNLVGKNFKKTFDLFVKELDEYGYNVYYKVLNAKNYGIPQNRERVILVAIRKDIDNGKFKYPEPFDNGIRLKDLLATQIDDRFYIPKEKTEKLLANLDEEKKKRLFESMNQINSLGLLDFKGNRQCRCVSGANGIAPTLTTMGGGQQEPKILESNMFNGETVSDYEIEKAVQEGNIKEGNPVKESVSSFQLPICCASRGRNPENPNSRVSGLPTEQRIEINENETTNTLTSVQKDNWIIEPCILRYARNEYGKKIRKEYEAGNIDEKMGNMRDLQMREDGLANTLTSVQKDNYVFEPSWFAIRKLIPLECFRLMGFTDEDFEKAKYYTEEEVKQLPKNKKYKKEISEKGEERYVLLADTHAYKQAGNSIVVNVLYEVYKELYKAMPELFDNLHLVSLFSGIGAFEKGLDMLYAWVDGNFTKEEE